MAHDIKAEDCARKSHFKIFKDVRLYLKAHGIEWTVMYKHGDMFDMQVSMLGEYRGMSLQIGDGYITVCANINDEAFLFHDVEGKVTLNEAMRNCLTQYKQELKKNLP